MDDSVFQDEFFHETTFKVNRLIAKILFCMIFIPIIFYILSQAKIFRLSTSYCVFICAIFSFFTISLSILSKINNKKVQNFAMYYGLLGCEFCIGMMFMNSLVNILITLGIVPFLSCFYYKKRVTIATNIFCFAFTIFILYLRSKDAILLGISARGNFAMQFISYVAGFCIEFFFVFVSTIYYSGHAQTKFLQMLSANAKANEFAESLKKQTIMISESEENFRDANQSLLRTQMDIIEFTAKVLGSHDLFTGRHVMHTQKYVEVIALQLRNDGYYENLLTDEMIQLYSSAAFLHDIGKIHVPEGILNKTGIFTPEEFTLMKTHPVEGKKLIEYLPKINDGRFNIIASEMAYYHHEKWDGSGYPTGVSGEHIPLCARIMAAADVLDALVSLRLYKKPVPFDKAIEIFNESSGKHFEPCIVQAVINCRNQLEEIDREFKKVEETSNKEELEWWINYHDSKETLKKEM